jgi:predicted PurR-regulated permease PerM
MNWTRNLFYLLLAVVLAATFIFYRWVLGYLMLSLVFTYILDPFVSWFERRRLPRWLSVLAVYGVIVGFLALLSVLFLPDLIRQGNNLFAVLNSGQANTAERIASLPLISNINAFLMNLDKQIPQLELSSQFIGMLESGRDFLTRLPKLIIDNYQQIIGTMSYLITVPLISFFLLKDKVLIRKSLIRAVPNRYFELVLILLRKVDETVGRFLRAMVFEVIIVSIMVSLALSIVGVRNSVLIGVTAGVANIIPYFGPFLGAALALMTALIDGSPFITLVWVGLAMYIVQMIDNYIIYPVVVGKTIRMHPLLVLLTVLAGGWFGGILWMLISVPVVYIVYSLVSVTHTNLKQFRLI